MGYACCLGGNRDVHHEGIGILGAETATLPWLDPDPDKGHPLAKADGCLKELRAPQRAAPVVFAYPWQDLHRMNREDTLSKPSRVQTKK